MIGQFFDVYWLYINRLEQLYERENDINKGLSKNLIDNVAKSFGIDLVNGKTLESLWKYSIGSDYTGSYIATGSAEDPIRSLSAEDMTYEV